MYGQQPQMMPPQPPQQDPWLQYFQQIDTDGSGSVASDELQRALTAAHGIQFNVNTSVRILNMFDKNKNGTLNYPEFKEAMGFVHTMKNGFMQRDTDRSGMLSGSEVRQALAASGYTLPDPIFQAVMQKMDRHKRGGLSVDGYIELSIIMGLVRNVFAFYDRTHSNQVVFDFSSFLGAVMAVV